MKAALAFVGGVIVGAAGFYLFGDHSCCRLVVDELKGRWFA